MDENTGYRNRRKFLEDFFFKSVFDEPGNSSLPVMIFIHGGGLIGGNNNYNQYGPQYFMEKKVVMVVINYRLGPFGFLSMGNSDVPGNAGFRDQTLVIRYLRDLF